jgi:hypothetical protein
MPSSFRSYIHSSLEKRSSVSTAFIGASHSGAGARTSSARSSGSKTAKTSELVIGQRLERPPGSDGKVLGGERVSYGDS